jgi:hypothetical protein
LGRLRMSTTEPRTTVVTIPHHGSLGSGRMAGGRHSAPARDPDGGTWPDHDRGDGAPPREPPASRGPQRGAGPRGDRVCQKRASRGRGRPPRPRPRRPGGAGPARRVAGRGESAGPCLAGPCARSAHRRDRRPRALPAGGDATTPPRAQHRWGRVVAAGVPAPGVTGDRV